MLPLWDGMFPGFGVATHRFSSTITEDGEDEFFPKEDAENYGRFIDASTGSASLIDGFIFTQRMKAYLKKHFDLEECPFIFTGGVWLSEGLATKTGDGHRPPLQTELILRQAQDDGIQSGEKGCGSMEWRASAPCSRARV